MKLFRSTITLARSCCSDLFIFMLLVHTISLISRPVLVLCFCSLVCILHGSRRAVLPCITQTEEQKWGRPGTRLHTYHLYYTCTVKLKEGHFYHLTYIPLHIDLDKLLDSLKCCNIEHTLLWSESYLTSWISRPTHGWGYWSAFSRILSDPVYDSIC